MPRDVMEVLARLPKACVVWDESQHCAMLIKRGVAGSTPYPLASKNDVEAFNSSHGVTPPQVAAMMAGSVCGWDSEGAYITSDDGDPLHIYAASLTLMLSARAPNEDEAAKLATSAVEAWVGNIILPDPMLSLTLDSPHLDFLEVHRDNN